MTRRLFPIEIMQSDAYADMSATARLLFLELYARADEEDTVFNVQSIMRQTRSARGDLELLTERGFVRLLDSGGWLVGW